VNPLDNLDDRLIAATPLNGDEAIDRAIRPKKLEDYVGQPVVKEQMEIFIQDTFTYHSK